MKTLKRLFLALLILGFLAFLGGAALLYSIYTDVAEEAKEKIQRGAIDSVIFSESPVYYDDGETVLGVFFDKTHRRYIEYKSIPPYFVKALVATEDQTFFTHPGFDIKAIVRAMIANYRAGRVAQGGSTLTQQTAKNIFTREKRSYQAKVKELMEALLLERQYTKEQILEMYVNQFFVTGIGRGLRIAAQYFFDKEAEDLNLVECAFIAGSLKSPNRFNPFTKRSEAEKRETRQVSRQRKDHVLGNMLAMNFISSQEHDLAKEKEVPFKQGKMGYRLNVILDYIREQLESDYFKGILQEQGVDNIATSGIRVYTSVNKEMQEGALRSIRKHLPLLDVKLSGYRDELLHETIRRVCGRPLRKSQIRPALPLQDRRDSRGQAESPSRRHLRGERRDHRLRRSSACGRRVDKGEEWRVDKFRKTECSRFSEATARGRHRSGSIRPLGIPEREKTRSVRGP